MLYQGTITSVSSLRQVNGQNSVMTFCTIVVENKPINDKRLGMVFECRGDIALKVAELWNNACQNSQPAPVMEVQYESIVRNWKSAKGEDRISQENVALNISLI